MAVFMVLWILVCLFVPLANAAAAADVVEKAKAEGKLVWWGGGTEAEDREFIKRFNQKYPFIKVEQWNTSSKATQERVWAEFTAKKYSWDVVTGGGAGGAGLGQGRHDAKMVGSGTRRGLPAEAQRSEWLLRCVWL